MRKTNPIGMRYGKLTVAEHTETRDSRRYFLCKCDCGGRKVVALPNLQSGNTKSCGCLPKRVPGPPKPKKTKAWRKKPGPKPAAPPTAPVPEIVAVEKVPFDPFYDKPTKRVSLPRLKFLGDPEPHDWSAWARREPVAVKRTRRVGL